jgi:hypothetical protein
MMKIDWGQEVATVVNEVSKAKGCCRKGIKGTARRETGRIERRKWRTV